MTNKKQLYTKQDGQRLNTDQTRQEASGNFADRILSGGPIGHLHFSRRAVIPARKIDFWLRQSAFTLTAWLHTSIDSFDTRHRIVSGMRPHKTDQHGLLA